MLEIGDSKNFREKFLEDWYNASPTIARSPAAGDVQPIQITMSAAEFMERYNSLTDIQLEFIRKIISECDESRSGQDLLAKLVTLNKEIHTKVPEIEQERLLNVIAVLYYGVQKVSYLERQGLMLITPYNNIKLSKIKTRGPEDGGSVAAGCTKFLATVWTIAVGEPTPFGEIVASVATVLVGVGAAATMMYEVITCKKQNMDVFCDNMYQICIEHDNVNNAPNSGGWGRTMCYECLRYCTAQGVWDCPRPKF